ncbi:antitoxin [Deinococcus arenicola]|uniref:Type II toxin-antitoxin system VapB family antitoxin n=1 Tax=Deinococcus arenicola TaxID=2994950 RepID=A0ABU4DUP0_9DEIO|nr:type II toxin-antitoxin system VapB family antitoxin [Deinococcus sp. ZS9-10]MDV6375682.1 type II toxin-antitoxin system VapB family antitoxin [Deinococcus sp. ZS9-10]
MTKHLPATKTAKLFQTGRSQAVRLPKEYRFEGDEVIIKRVGDGVLLLPRNNRWKNLLSAVERFDVQLEREQPEMQERDWGEF